MRHDEDAVQSVLTVLAPLPNPFAAREAEDDEADADAVLCTIFSGVIASSPVRTDLLQAYNIGEKNFLKFVRDRLQTNTTAFHARLPALKLATFTSMTKAKAVKVSGREVIVRADSHLFARMLVVAQTREMELKEVLTYELGPMPWSLATVDGGLVKTAKAKLLALLEDGVAPAEQIPPNAAWMIDAMAVLQGISTAPPTFADLAKVVFDVTTSAPFQQGSLRVDFVVDRYPAVSIKTAERSARARGGVLITRIFSRKQRCPTQWRKYLASGVNKEDLSEFLVLEWRRPEYAARLNGRVFYVTHGIKCTRLSSSDGTTVQA